MLPLTSLAGEFKDKTTGAILLSGALADKACLIVLDDVWDHSVAEPFKGLISPRSRLVITTRKRDIGDLLRINAQLIEKLSPEQGVALIQAYCGAVDEAICREIAERLGGHTLAVSIAAAWIAKRGAGQEANLVRRLHEGRTFQDFACMRKTRT